MTDTNGGQGPGVRGLGRRKKMNCPVCGSEMNHHADKIDYSITDVDAQDYGTGGIIQEVHMCPECGWTEMRIER